MKKITTIILIALFSAMGYGQPFTFDVSFAVGSPQGSFQQVLDRDAYGIDMGVTYQLGKHSPVHIGAGFLYQNYGWKERQTQFVEDVPEVDVTVRTTNNLITPHFILRLEPDLGFFSPFLESTIGFNYLFTESSIVDKWDEDRIASTVNYDYFTSNMGIGGGIKFRVWEGFDGDGDFYRVHLIVKSHYMLGGEALYLTEGDLIPNGNTIEYTVRRSRTDLTTFNVGISLSF